jgi:hypothetical protein
VAETRRRWPIRIFRRRERPLDRAEVAILAAATQNTKPEPQWSEAEVRCPLCSSTDVYWSLTCHTYSVGKAGEERWMSCLPCDSAVRYGCANEGCDWAYTHGLNPRNPNANNNERFRAPWLPAELQVSDHSFPWTRPGVRAIWDNDDD